jgi:hypothetical protein
MNLPSGPSSAKAKAKTLITKNHENTLAFHSRLIEAAEVRFSRL